MKNIACIGMAVADVTLGHFDEFNFNQDVTLVDNVNITAGGDSANVAINLLNMQTQVSLYGKIGDDLMGKFLLETYEKLHMDTSNITISKGENTATCITLVNKEADRVFLYHGGSTASLGRADIKENTLYEYDIIHASGFFLLPKLENEGLDDIFKIAKEKGKITTLDVGWDNSNRWFENIRSILPHVSYFLPTDNEAEQITKQKNVEDMAKFLLDQGVENVVIKMGAKGAYAHNGKDAQYIKGVPVKTVVDTTGAGDSFVAGFLASLARGNDLWQSVKMANISGGLTVQDFGTNNIIKSYKDLTDIYNNT